MTNSVTQLRLGTRTSKLALWQTQHIIERLQEAWRNSGKQIEYLIVPFSTVGDKTQSEGKPLPEVGGKGLFTAELEAALRSGEIDLAVHSLKDLPVENAEGLTLGAIPTRADVRDVLIARNGWKLASLPQSAHVGTSSTRRAAQLRVLRPDLKISSIRGNIDTRIRKVMNGEYDATLLALAGLERLNLNAAISETLSLEMMLPAPGQGALAVQCRADDLLVLHLLAAIDDAPTRAATTAERAFLAALGGGCSAPVAAYAHFVHAQELEMQALIADSDGSQVVHVQQSRKIPQSVLSAQTVQATQNSGIELLCEFGKKFGEELARKALQQGADQILARFGLQYNHLPLLGKRIVVTRRPEQAAELMTQLSVLGATPIAIPVIEIVPTDNWDKLDAAIAMLQGYDWLLFTSANAVDLFFQRVQEKGQTPAAYPPIAVIGSATALALARYQVRPALIPTTATGEAMAAALNEMDKIDGKRILLPQAAIARLNLVESLTAAGVIVDSIPIYDTIAAEPSAAAIQELQNGVDALIFTSGSTVRNFFEFIRAQNLSAAVQNATIACIGPITAEAAQEQGISVHIIASEQTTPGIIQSLLHHYTQTDKT